MPFGEDDLPWNTQTTHQVGHKRSRIISNEFFLNTKLWCFTRSCRKNLPIPNISTFYLLKPSFVFSNFFDFVPMVSMPKILHQLSIMSSSISMAEAGSIPKPSHGAPKCALQGDFFGVKPRDVTLKHPKIYQNLTGVIEWCILGGDQTWCKCMVILRDFPY